MSYSVRPPGPIAWQLTTILIALCLLPSPGSAQFIDQHFSPVPFAPESGTYPEPVQQAIEEGLRQLEQVASPEDDLHLDAAEAAFERALAADPGAVHALNGMGIYELGKDEQWLVLLESLKKVLNRDHISMAIGSFEDALEADPTFHAARFNLALAYRQARGEDNYRKATAQLEKLLREAPDFPDAALVLAATYRDAGELERMTAAIESIPAGPTLPPAGRQLLLAYALFNTEQPEAGANHEGQSQRECSGGAAEPERAERHRLTPHPHHVKREERERHQEGVDQHDPERRQERGVTEQMTGEGR